MIAASFSQKEPIRLAVTRAAAKGWKPYLPAVFMLPELRDMAGMAIGGWGFWNGLWM